MKKWFFDDESVFNFPVIKTYCDLAIDSYEKRKIITVKRFGQEPLSDPYNYLQLLLQKKRQHHIKMVCLL